MYFFSFVIYVFSTNEIHIDGYVFFLQESDCLKLINHDRKILELEEPTATWFVDVIRYSGLVDLYSSAYMTINHDIQATFVER